MAAVGVEELKVASADGARRVIGDSSLICLISVSDGNQGCFDED